jgi:hypothetical protein
MGLKQTLPKWFDGVIYETGDIVVNPFSGEEYKLNNIELSIYDLIMGCNYIGDYKGWDNELINIQHKGLDWFRKYNPKAYMVLLD